MDQPPRQKALLPRGWREEQEEEEEDKEEERREDENWLRLERLSVVRRGKAESPGDSEETLSGCSPSFSLMGLGPARLAVTKDGFPTVGAVCVK
ncbi:hypothetical protein ACOMHN_056849 [Nucella lapillus]